MVIGFDTRDTQIDPKVAVGTPELSVEAALPETLPVLVDCREGDESSDCDLDSCPQLARTQLNIWREHPNFSIGIRLAELATMWLVHGWQRELFPQFTHWLTRQSSYLIGTLNHSERWLKGFQASLIQACHTCTASSLHVVVPATGTPSFPSRIIDAVSIDSTSLLPTFHAYHM